MHRRSALQCTVSGPVQMESWKQMHDARGGRDSRADAAHSALELHASLTAASGNASGRPPSGIESKERAPSHPPRSAATTSNA